MYAETWHSNYNAAAKIAAASFTTDTRPNGSAFIRRTDDAPGWVGDAVYDAHDGAMPDDRTYELCASAADAIERAAAADADMDDARHWFADGSVDTYNEDRIAWLESCAYRVALVDEVHDDMGMDRGDLMDQIAAGQYEEARRVFDVMADAIERAADEMTETDDEIEQGNEESATATIADADAIAAAVGVTR